MYLFDNCELCMKFVEIYVIFKDCYIEYLRFNFIFIFGFFKKIILL